MMKNRKQIWVTAEFKDMLKNRYPDHSSVLATKELKRLLDEMLYAKKK